MLHLKNQFEKIYASYFGEKLDKPDDKLKNEISGSDLKAFCEYYLQHFRTADEFRYSKDDRRVSRILWFTIGFIIAIFLSLIATRFDLTQY